MSSATKTCLQENTAALLVKWKNLLFFVGGFLAIKLSATNALNVKRDYIYVSALKLHYVGK